MLKRLSKRFQTEEDHWNKIEGPVIDVACYGDQVWCITDEHVVYELVNRTWMKREKKGIRVSVSEGDTKKKGFWVWLVTEDDEVILWDRTKWETMPISLHDISAASSVVVWGINKNNEVFHWDGITWKSTEAPDNAVQVSVGHDGHVCLLDKDQNLYFREIGTATGWRKIENISLKHVSCFNRDTIVGTNEKNEIFRYDNGEWKRIDGHSNCLAVGAAGYRKMWGANASSEVRSHR